MTREELADLLIRAKNKTEAAKLLASADGLADVKLAYAIKENFFALWANEPTISKKAAIALGLLAGINDDKEIACVMHWIKAISEITEGKLENSLESFRIAHDGFLGLGKTHEAAQTQNAQMIPLGLLGDYELAVAVGQEALETFESLNDEIAAAKIETNLAIVANRQGKYRESKEYCISARDRFQELGETQWLLMAENDLAMALTELSEFEEAAERYNFALGIAQSEKMHMTEADILANLGNLQTFRGQYGPALRSLELSRQKYTELNMPHRSVIADSEIAEIYQILNLTDEANEIYEKVVVELNRFRLRAEEARARSNFGKLALSVGNLEKCEAELEKAASLFMLEGNPAGAASVQLVGSRSLNSRGEFQKALELIDKTDAIILGGEFPYQAIESQYLRGETLRLLGEFESASKFLNKSISDAKPSEQSNTVVNGLVSLAKIAIETNDPEEAEKRLCEAVAIVEHLRAPIPAEEFRMAFLADKLLPFELLSKIYLKQDNIELAFAFAEQARSRTLFEKLGRSAEKTANENPIKSEYERQREKLNWYYNRLARETGDQARLRDSILRIEKELSETALRDSSILEGGDELAEGVDWTKLRELVSKELGNSRAMIEYTLDEGQISAFVIDGTGIRYFENITTEEEVTRLLEGLRFQFESMRFSNISVFGSQLKKRADKYLNALYKSLFAPFEESVSAQNLIIIPVGQLFYVPFNALFDGEEYLVENGTVNLAPSAAIWSRLSYAAKIGNESALVVAYSDENAPLIDRESSAVTKSLSKVNTFAGPEAVLKNYFEHAEEADIIHFACHGEFRADSPLYSNLRLADGFLTVRDIAKQELRASLVTLSACETGLNKIYAGEEILGLARGFLGAGARNIVMSLWTVNDEATSTLMKTFYDSLISGNDAPQSLRIAQKQLIESGMHPYFWATFVIIGK